MKNINPKPFLYVLVVFSFLVLFVSACIKGFDISRWFDLIRLVPIVVTVDAVAYVAFARWVWRWTFLQDWLVPFPDLNGTWQGHIQTDWRNQNGCKPGPIPVILTIKQTFGRISCVMRTAEMESHSYVEGFSIDTREQIRRLVYSYTSNPKVGLRARSTPHDGTILFRIIGNPVNKLEGEYWTQRKTTGTVTLTFRHKGLLDEMPDDLAPHPMVDSQGST